MMRRFLVLLALAVLVALCDHRVAAEAEHSEELLEEVVDAAEPGPGDKPMLSPEAFAKIFAKMSNKCQKEIEANPQDPEQLSPRCRNELGRKIERHLQREKEGPKEKKQQTKQDKPKKKKSKKQSRAQREAAAAAKQEEEYMHTVKVIIGFVATLLAGIVGVMCVINRKLKAEGMYYPANPEEKAGGCCG